ncbi:PP0621 family protein [Thiomicrospira sp. ALE5]|uniref:PP0621 family protein n=1 Tax=Thiomicrospira sp. ALE5 TaxID=748650 RepID=UPI0008F02DAA|nr:PP0621 family protein [Thiomicrospira sp. ALE5]SFR52027.1 uncharacterized protein SAMN03092900_0610 [Thiomicrospira sp. ALE5]
MQAILFISLAILVFLVLRMLLNLIVEAREKLNSSDKQPKLEDSQQMVRCAHCGIHLPQSEAYFDGRHTYCSEGHMRKGPKVAPNSSYTDVDDD